MTETGRMTLDRAICTPARRRVTLSKRMLAATALLLAASGTARAADMLPAQGAERLVERRQGAEAVIVVPGCDERGSGLIRCEPRDNLFYPADADLNVIERSVPERSRRPYPELFGWGR